VVVFVVVHMDGVILNLYFGHQRAHCSSPSDDMSMESHGGMILTGKDRRTRIKPYSIATLYSTNPTWIDSDANPGLRGERPAANHLSHGTVFWPVVAFYPARVNNVFICSSFNDALSLTHTISRRVKR
jgi:hypothetical protein